MPGVADRTVTILHTNDLHGYPGTIPRLAAPSASTSGCASMIADIVARRLSNDLGGSLPAIDGRLRFES